MSHRFYLGFCHTNGVCSLVDKAAGMTKEFLRGHKVCKMVEYYHKYETLSSTPKTGHY